MANFNIRRINKSKLTDSGVPIKLLLNLLDREDALNLELIEKLSLNKFKKDDFMPIVGANALFNVQEAINKRFHKKDYVSIIVFK